MKEHIARAGRKAGFTLLELMMASAISVVVVAMAFGAFVSMVQMWNQEGVISELNIDLDLSMAHLRRDLRLSSVGVGHMAFYPADSASYTAISFPRAVDSDGDGVLERDENDLIEWDQTVIYHIRPGSPDELVRTVFAPRYDAASPAELYNQLATVVASSNASQIAAAALSGESPSSKVIFANLVNMRVHPPSVRFDGYAASPELAEDLNFGSVVLSAGTHELVFTVDGKNVNSSGYKIGVDSITLGSTHGPLDGELFVPANSHPKAGWFSYSNNTGTVIAEDMSQYGVGWSGRSQLTFSPTGMGGRISLFVPNDMWVDNNFDEPAGTLLSNVVVSYDRNFTNVNPYIGDMVVTLDKGVAWTADRSADGTAAVAVNGGAVAVTNFVYGGTTSVASVSMNGRWARLRFDAAETLPLFVTNVTLTDVSSGAESNVTFNGGAAGVEIPAGATLWSDWVPDFEVNTADDYRVAAEYGGPGDQDRELWLGDNDGELMFSENTGTPAVPAWAAPESEWQSLDVGAFSTPVFGDLDGDGDDDLLLGEIGGRIFYVRRGGTSQSPVWSAPAAYAGIDVGAYSSPTLADIDADGDLDLIIGESLGTLHYYQNTGSVSRAVWASPVAPWLGLDTGSYSAPHFGDLDGDGDLDLMCGEYPDGHVFYIENVGTKTSFAMGSIVTNTLGAAHSLTHPVLEDIDADGDLDLFIGNKNGRVIHLPNTGNGTNAIFASTNWFFGSIDSGSWSAPAFANINSGTYGARAETNANVAFSTLAGVAFLGNVGLGAIEVGYPDAGVFRSGVYDTQLSAPVFNELNWTQVERFSEGGDVDIRVRSAATKAGIASALWTTAQPSANGFFQSNMGNSLATLPKQRFVQYEAQLRCFKSSAHTNDATAILRDVSIDWPGPTGIVDLQANLSRGPDYGIIKATVDGQEFVKGVTVELEIFKYSRPFGTNVVSGMMEIKPLNTGF